MSLTCNLVNSIFSMRLIAQKYLRLRVVLRRTAIMAVVSEDSSPPLFRPEYPNAEMVLATSPRGGTTLDLPVILVTGLNKRSPRC
jgi:hypothetical protein